MKIALVHDFLTQYGGAERVLDNLCEIFPEAPIYTLIYNPETMASHYGKKKIITSFLQKKPWATKKSRWYLPWMPAAIESFDFSKYDLVISDASAFAKGIITLPKTLHICYCHTPTRYLWNETTSYLKKAHIPWPINSMMPLVINYLRVWDYAASQRADYMIANSKYVKERIAKYYRRDASVINPSVDTKQFSPSNKKDDYYLMTGRLVSYKRYDIVVEAFNKMPDKKLFIAGSNVVAGSGVIDDSLEKLATSKNIHFLGQVSDEKLKKLYAEAKAYIFPAEEDFGITPLEAMASGTPVVAFGKGGATETVIDKKTGLFFAEQTPESVCDAIKKFETMTFKTADLVAQAQKFEKIIFKQKIKTYINKCINKRKDS